MKTTRHAAAILLLIPLLVSCSCGVDVFDTQVKATTTLEGSSGILGLLEGLGPMAGFTNIDFSANQDFKNQGVTRDDVDSVKITRLTLRITAPNDQDFRFLESLQFFAEANGQKVLVAEKHGIDKLGLVAPNPVLEMEVKDVELAPFVTAPAMSLTTEGTGRQPAKDTTIEAVVDLRVDVSAGALGRLVE